MRLKLIGCEVFTREVCHCVARSPHRVDIEFTDKGAHDDSASLRALIQNKIDTCAASEKKYDAILLCFGLCGNATLDLEAKGAPIVIPRAHDCCTIFLGSKASFVEHFGDNPSSSFSSTGYMERGGSFTHEPSEISKQMGLEKTYEAYIEEYGEENGNDYRQLPGGIGLVERLIFGDWNEDEFLIVEPAHRITGVYDMKEIVKAPRVE